MPSEIHTLIPQALWYAKYLRILFHCSLKFAGTEECVPWMRYNQESSRLSIHDLLASIFRVRSWVPALRLAGFRQLSCRLSFCLYPFGFADVMMDVRARVRGSWSICCFLFFFLVATRRKEGRKQGRRPAGPAGGRNDPAAWRLKATRAKQSVHLLFLGSIVS